MEPFTILCETCASRLKVTQPRAIGQKLACPKCNSMVLVVAPEGVQVPLDETGSSSGFEFDDIEKILQSSPAAPGQPGSAERQPDRAASQGKGPVPPSQPAAPATQAGVEASQSAPAPGESWTSEAAKSRQKWLIAGAIAVGSIVLVAAFIGMMMNQAGTRPDPPAVAAHSDAATSPPDPAAELPKEKGDTDSSTKEQPAQDDPVDPSEIEPPADEKKPNDDPNSSPVPSDPASPETKTENSTPTDEQNPPTVMPEIPKDGQPGGEGPTETDSDPKAEPGRPNGLDSLLIGMDKRGDDSVLNSNLGELSNLLEKKGTSILEINDLAAVIRNSEMIGLPRYHFDKPAPFDPGTLERLQDPCAGVQYEGIPALVALREISLITGVPFQLNVEAIASRKIDLATPVDFKLVDKNFIEVASEMLQPLDLTVTFDGTNIPLIEPVNETVLVDRQYDLPQLDDPDGKKIDRFMESIKGLVAPQSWQAEENPATIQREENRLLIHQTPENHQRIQDYLSKIQAGLQMAAGNELEADRFENRWSAVQEKTSQPFQSRFRSPVTLGAMLNRLQQVSQVNVVVDWASVLPTGWTPQTIVPAKVEEKSVDEAIRQLVRTMGLTSRYIDANTIEITTFQSAANARELEVYSCHQILGGNMTPEALMRALEGALNFNVNQLNNVRVVYEPECQCVIALAPQLVQRQIQAILDRLAGN